MKTSKKQGFTLIELIIVVAIIGILAALAVPSFMVYRKKGYDKRAGAVLKVITTAQAAYNAANNRYSITPATLSAVDPNLPLPSATAVQWDILSATATGFVATASHALGTGVTFTADQSSVLYIY